MVLTFFSLLNVNAYKIILQIKIFWYVKLLIGIISTLTAAFFNY